MEKFNQDELVELWSLAEKLGVNEDVVLASGLAVTYAVSDSVEQKTIVRGSRPPWGTMARMFVEPLVKVTRTRSIKLSNLAHADMKAIIEIVAGSAVTVADIVAEPHPIIIAAGLLLMICSFTRAMTIELSDREASVFWGLIQSSDKKKVAKLDAIIENTNRVREEVGLNPISEAQIRESLIELIKIKSISRVKGEPSAWRIREWWKTSRFS